MYSSHKLFCIVSLVCTVLNAAESESIQLLARPLELRKQPPVNYSTLQKQNLPTSTLPTLAISPTTEIASPLSVVTTQSPLSEGTTTELGQRPPMQEEQPIKLSRKRKRKERLSHDEIVKRGILLAFEQSRAKSLQSMPQISANPVKFKKPRQMTASEELIKITMKALADKVTHLEKKHEEEKEKVATLEQNQLILMWVIKDMQERLFMQTQPSPMLPTVHESQQIVSMDTLAPIPQESTFEQYDISPLNQNGFAQSFVQQKIITKVPDVLR